MTDRAPLGSQKNTPIATVLSRRDFVRRTLLAGMAMSPITRGATRDRSGFGQPVGPATLTLPFNRDWLFVGRVRSEPGQHAPSPITLPHCVAKLSWQNWDPAAWQDLWKYRRRFAVQPEFRGARVFLHFEGVMVGATPTLNGHEFPQHLGGYLPFEYELTNFLNDGENSLEVVVDSRWSNVPPEGSPQGTSSVDFLEAGGIHRSVWLKAVPQVFIRDVFANPVQVLDPARRVEIACTIDAALVPEKPVDIAVELRDGPRVASRARSTVRIEKPGQTIIRLTASPLRSPALWDVDAPHLYDVVTTLTVDGKAIHDHRVRIGLREARFELNGFFLNGRRLQLFGLDRHEIYPYVGGAMPDRVMRRDAELLRREFNCNIVRCSHYPQSPAFLDACDELGLMVWEEVPGWWYIGDDAWKDLLVRNVHDMIVRDRNHPAIVIWGVRANETPNDVELYRRTTTLAKSLDDSRPASGSMTPWSRKDWQEHWREDVFAYDDYHAEPDGSVGIEPPVPDVPYMLSEAVGQFDYAKRDGFAIKYRRAGDPNVQQLQAVRHAQAHSRAAADPRICGVIAWCAFDYASLINSYNAVKTPGIADVFRIPKLGASFYQAQGDPNVRPVIQPSFYWDFGSRTPNGPGQHVAIFSNCDRLELFIGGQPHSTVHPDRENFPHLKHPPFFANFETDGRNQPTLRIDGYLTNRLALSRSFSSDPSHDQLTAAADDSVLIADGSDATRIVFKVVDEFGAERAFAQGTVGFDLQGPGTILGDNPFSLVDSGGVGAIWIRTVPGGRGRLRLAVRHSDLGTKIVEVEAR